MAALWGLVWSACGATTVEDFEEYTTDALLPDPPYQASDIVGISGDNPGIFAYSDPAGVQGGVGGRKGESAAHHATMRELPALAAPTTQIVFQAEFMSDFSTGTWNTDNLLVLAGGPGDRDLVIGVNDGLLSAFFEDPITPGDQRLRGNGGNVVSDGVWYTVRAVVTFPAENSDGLLQASWKLTSEPDPAFAAMAGSSANTEVAAPDQTQASWLHWEIRNSISGGSSNTGSYADDVLIEVWEGEPPGPDVVPSESISVADVIGIEFDSVSGESYSLEVTTNLVDWTQTGAVILGNDTRLTMFDPTGSSTSETYRVIRLP